MTSKTGGGRGTNQHAVKGRSVQRPAASRSGAAEVAVAATADVPERVDVLRCDSCDDLVESVEGPVYECSRCGGVQMGDRRCESCHVFMAKVSDTACPNCEDYDGGFVPVSAWRVQGRVFDTEHEAQEWVDDTPNREARAEEARRELDERLNAHRAERVAAHEARLPRMKELRDLLDPAQTPDLASTMNWNVERGEIEEDWNPSIPMTTLSEFAAIVDEPGTRTDRKIATDYSKSFEERDAANRRLRETVVNALPDGPVKERLDDHFVSATTGVGSSMDETLDALLPILRERQK